MDELIDAIASFNPIERAWGLIRSVRVSRGLHHQHAPRLVGVRRIEWPRSGPTGGEVEKYLARRGIKISNRGFTGNAKTGTLWCDVPETQAWAQYLVDDLCNGVQHPALVDQAPVSTPKRKRRKPRKAKPAPQSDIARRIKGWF